MAGERLVQIEVQTEAALLAWLDVNHQQTESVWLVTFKKSSPEKYIERETVLRALLRYGWIDSLPRKKDAHRSMLLISPRKVGSAWSALNKRIIADLENEGLLTTKAAAQIKTAKEDGSWQFLDDVEACIIPDDLDKALRESPPAFENFSAFPKSSRRGILEWIKQAKRAETRAKRINETATLAARNIRALQRKT